MKLIIIAALLAFVGIASSQTIDQLMAARDMYRGVAETIDDYVRRPMGSPLEDRLHLTIGVLSATSSNMNAATACYGLYQTTSYVCGLAAMGVPASGVPSAASAATDAGHTVSAVKFPS